MTRRKRYIMTKREFFEVIVNANVETEVKEFAKAGLANLDKVNSNRAAKAAEKRAEVNGPLVEQFNRIIADGNVHGTAELAEALGVKVAKVAVIAKLAGAEKTKIKVGKSYRVAYKVGTNA